jgi:hypothetical protein
MDLTPASQSPPKCGTDGGINCHSMFLLATFSAVSLDAKNAALFQSS